MTFARAAQRRDWWLKLMQDHPEIQQFGQPHSGSTWGGKTACLHTCVQAVLLGWTGTFYTIDEISEMAGYPNPPIMSADRWDLSSDQAVDASIRALSNAGVAYEFVQWDWADLEERSQTHGPVIFGCAYDAQPEWRGYVYKDSVSTGDPNGFARPLRRAGKTQLSGFKGGHAELLIGIRDVIGKDGSLKRRDNYVKDPNHGSPARPERPPYDIMTSAQGRYLYESWSTLGNTRRWAIVPLSVHDTVNGAANTATGVLATVALPTPHAT